jgi:2-succinyl-5-enolpyruvyl-6-hydroxy-3-cyclohexene-1-carboxylate synthase
VHVNAPFREPTVPASDDGRTTAQPFRHPLDGRPGGAPWTMTEARPHVPADHVLEDVAAMLLAEPHGLVVVGGGIGAPPGDVTGVAALLGWPVVAEPHSGVAGGGVLDHATLLLGDARHVAAHPPRLLLRLGRPTVAREVVQLATATPQVVVDAHGGWGAVDLPHATLVRGEVAPTMEALAALLRANRPDRVHANGSDGTWRSTWLAADAVAGEVVGEVLTGVSEPRTLRDVAAAVPAGGALVVGSSMPIRDLDLAAASRGDVTVHANRGASGIDGFTSTALGVALAHPGPVVAVCGDLTALHDSNGWLLRADPAGAPPDLVLVVLDNDGGGIFSFLPQRDHVAAFERLVGTPHGRDLTHLAALHGLAHTRPTTPAEVVAAVTDGLAAGGRHLVHVRTDREENLALHRDLRTAVADALATP